MPGVVASPTGIRPLGQLLDPTRTRYPEFWREGSYWWPFDGGSGDTVFMRTAGYIGTGDRAPGHATIAQPSFVERGVGPRGPGLRVNGGDPGNAAVLSLASPDPGFWHDAVSVRSYIAYVQPLSSLVSATETHGIIEQGAGGEGLDLNYDGPAGEIQWATDDGRTIIAVDLDVPLMIVAVWDEPELRLYVNGVSSVNASAGSVTSHASGPAFLSVEGSSTRGVTRAWPGWAYYLGVSTSAVDRWVPTLVADPFAPFRSVEDRVIVTTGGGGVTGGSIMRRRRAS